MELRFHIDCVPPTATAQHKGVFVVGGKPRFFTKKPVRDAENFLAALLARHRPPAPFSAPVSLCVRWTFPFRKSERKAVIRAGADIPHTSRPDLDNLEKSLLDVLTRLNFWTDDSLVAEKHTSKHWGATPGIDIAVHPLTGAGATDTLPAHAPAREVAQGGTATEAPHTADSSRKTEANGN